MNDSSALRAIVFDLDGTLYVSDSFAASIHEAAAEYIAGLRRISRDEACLLMADVRCRLAGEIDLVPTLSAVCRELGGSIRDLHSLFEARLRPEAYLMRDQRVIDLLLRLSGRCDLYLYTNNNRTLATRILNYLGLDGIFRRIYTIDDSWQAKPHADTIGRIVSDAGVTPAQALFVGDRYDVDLRLPEQLGCPVYLSQSVEQLLRLEELIGAAGDGAADRRR